MKSQKKGLILGPNFLIFLKSEKVHEKGNILGSCFFVFFFKKVKNTGTPLL